MELLDYPATSMYFRLKRKYFYLFIYTKGIRKLNSDELLTKQEMKKQISLHTKITYILKLLLNVFTAGIEAFVVSGDKLWYACLKEVCRL
jgi:hypothetical protein